MRNSLGQFSINPDVIVLPPYKCRRCGSLEHYIFQGDRVCKPCKRSRTYRNRNSVKENRKLKIEVQAAYGSKCNCCGETTFEFLAIDHTNNDGAAFRKQTGLVGLSLYRWLRRNGYPKEGFQLLCHNCNCAKGFYGVCPHEKSRMQVMSSVRECNHGLYVGNRGHIEQAEGDVSTGHT